MSFNFVWASNRLLSLIVSAASVCCVLSMQGCTPTTKDEHSGSIVPGASSGDGSAGAGGNHLKGEVSPYLLEHSGDPVDWYPWGDEAFARAKRENKPIFLSSGFAACHWCHVMQRESFQDPATAKFLNDNFISIKVDREERPYVDEVYTRAAMAVGGRGGWPLTVFLTPDKKPFFAGTYFPKTEGSGLPAFTKVLQGVLDSWHDHRDTVDKVANELCKDIYKLDHGLVAKQLDRTTLDDAGTRLLEEVDTEFGGVVGERKFVLPGTLALAMQMVASAPRAGGASPANPAGHRQTPAQKYLAYVTSTLDHMADGGVHDQLRGGFFRYATDRDWHIPHFEKMLCDNALIAQTYLDGALLTGNKQWRAIGLQTLDFCLSDFVTPDGCFYGSMDADSGGQEGAFYTFTPEEIKTALGVADGQLFCTVYSVSSKGNTSDGRSVLYFSESQERLASGLKLTLSQFQAKLAALKSKLTQSILVHNRVRPTLDKKVIVAWSSLLISALVDGYKVSGEEKYLTAAKKCAHFLADNLCQGKIMHRIWADGKAEVSACLDDYAYTVRAFLDLAEVDSDPLWLTRASAWNGDVVDHFFSHHVGFYYTANNKDQALMRTGCARDAGEPSPMAIEVANLLRLYELRGDSHLKTVAERTMKLYGDQVTGEPTGFGFLLSTMEIALHKTERLVVLEGADKDLAKQLNQQLWQFYAPHVVSILAAPQEFVTITQGTDQTGLFGQMAPAKVMNDNSAAYFCSGNTCGKPIAHPASLKDELGQLAAQGGL